MKKQIKILDIAMLIVIGISVYNAFLSIQVNKHLLQKIKTDKKNGIEK